MCIIYNIIIGIGNSNYVSRDIRYNIIDILRLELQ